MKKQVIYTTEDNMDFKLEEFLSLGKPVLQFDLLGQNVMYFLTMDEINEFCGLLQETGKEIFRKTFDIEEVK